MMTTTHVLLNAVVGHRLARRRKVLLKSLMLGGVAPDVPLLILSAGYFAYRRWLVPMPPGEGVWNRVWDVLYFHDPYWVFLTMFFHAPLLIAAMAWIGDRRGRRGLRFGDGLFWFAVGCGIHSLLDIVTHHDDGPLLLYPFSSTIRFPSPISYWHPAYYGRQFAMLEWALVAATLLYFAAVWVRSRWGQAPASIKPPA